MTRKTKSKKDSKIKSYFDIADLVLRTHDDLDEILTNKTCNYSDYITDKITDKNYSKEIFSNITIKKNKNKELSIDTLEKNVTKRYYDYISNETDETDRNYTLDLDNISTVFEQIDRYNLEDFERYIRPRQEIHDFDTLERNQILNTRDTEENETENIIETYDLTQNITHILNDGNDNAFLGIGAYWSDKVVAMDPSLIAFCRSFQGRVYSFGPEQESIADPETIRQECITDYIAYCERFIDPENQKQASKVKFAKGILEHNSDMDINEFLGSLYKNNRNAILALLGDQLKTAETLEDLALTEEQNQALTDIAFSELDILLKSNPSKLDEQGKTLETVLKKYNPDIYENEMGTINSYSIEITRDPALIKKAAMATGSACIRHRSEAYFNHVASDDGTIFLVGRKNGKIQGYSRLFLMKDQDDELVLAIDTIEPPAKDFENNKGLINAFAFTSVRLGLELGARYVVMEDSRVKYGPRQAYGNTNKKMTLTKLGKHDVTSYKIRPEYSGTPYVLIENWRDSVQSISESYEKKAKSAVPA